MLTLTSCHASDWSYFVKFSIPNRGDDHRKRQQLAEQGKEEAQEGSGSEGDPGKACPSNQEAVTADRVFCTYPFGQTILGEW